MIGGLEDDRAAAEPEPDGLEPEEEEVGLNRLRGRNQRPQDPDVGAAHISPGETRTAADRAI